MIPAYQPVNLSTNYLFSNISKYIKNTRKVKE